MSQTARVALLTCLVCLLSSSSGRGIVRAQEPQVFRADVDLVQLDVVVLDRNRRPVTGLTAADFTILEDGKPREVEAFAAVALPAPMVTTGAVWTREIAPDVADNTREADGRLVVIVMDRSIPAGPPTVTARTIAHAAVDALGPTDLAVVLSTSGFSNEGAPQNFTRDRALLRAAIDAPFMGLVTPPGMGGGGLVRGRPELRETGDCICGTCVTDTLVRVADALAAERRLQKTVLFIGSDIVIQEQPMASDFCSVPINDGRERVLRTFDRANVTLHSLDPSGLETLVKGADAFPNDVRDPPMRTLVRQGNLAVLPDYTGGRTVLNTNAPESLVPEIFTESQSYYLLGFQRTPGGRPDQRRTIRVRVNREGVTVRSRTGYYAPVPASEAPVAVEPSTAAVGGLLPKTDVPLSLGLAPRFRADGTPEVSVLLGVTHGGGDSARVFDVTLGVFDERARPVGSERQTMEVPASLAVRDTIETQSHLALAPGRYEIRAGVADAASDKSGSVYGYVEVPDLSRGALTLSGILIDAREKPAIELPMPAMTLPLAPTLRRTFARTDTVTASVQVHQRADPRAVVSLHTRIVDANDRLVTESSQTLDASRFNAGDVADVSVTIPVATLDPGQYLLTMEAVSGGRTQRRDVRFQVQ